MNPARREPLLRWLLAVGLAALLLFFFSPSWVAFHMWSRVPELGELIEVRRGITVLQQAAHPGAPIEDSLHRAIQWRLLFPWIGHFLHLPPAVLFGLAPAGCVIALGYIVILVRRAGANWQVAAYLGVIAGAASWFFTSTGWLGYFDSWVVLALLVVAFGRSHWSLWAACVWAPWVDERMVVAAPLALTCRWLYHLQDDSNKTRRSIDSLREVAIPAALLALFAFIRLVILAGHSDSAATISGYLTIRNYLDAPLGRIALGIWEGLRVGWIFAGFSVIALSRSPMRAALLAVLVILTAAVGLATAQDYSRSMTMLFPVVVLGAILAIKIKSTGIMPRILPFCAGATLLLPAHHVMNDRVGSIYYLYSSLAALRIPPPVAMPQLYELRGIHAMENGDFAAAERDFTLAIKLAENPASPARQRGVLHASQNRWAEARADFVLATEHEPENPDAWFLRSQASLASGDAAAAQSEFDHARSLAAPEWISRPDVVRFASRLAAPAR